MAAKMTRIDHTKNMARFYEIDIRPGLFGDVSVIRHWGRIGTQGQSLENWYENNEDASVATARIVRQKIGRGYIALPVLASPVGG